MLNFIAQNMLYDENAVERKDVQRIPHPDENEWDAIIEQVQNNEQILEDLVKNVEKTPVEVQKQFFDNAEPERTAEIEEANEQMFPVAIEIPKPTTENSVDGKEIVIEKHQTILVEEVRIKEKKSIRKRLIGFFRRSSLRTKKKTWKMPFQVGYIRQRAKIW